MRSGWVARRAAWALVLASACNSPRGGAPASRGAGAVAATAACAEVITAPLAREIFARLTAIHTDDRCVIADLTTRQSTMSVRWTRDGAALPDVVVVTPAACAPDAAATGRYAIQSTARFTATCPATAAALQRAFSQGAPAPGRPEGRRPPSRRSKLPVALVAAVVGLVAVGWSRWRAR